jgi:protein LTV1
LEDEEYVDDEEDIFGELTKDGYEVDRDEWERLGEQQVFDEEDEGWESDDTIKAPASPREPPPDLELPEGDEAMPPEDPHAVPSADPTQGAWLDEFKKFNSAAKANKPEKSGAAPSTLESSAFGSLASGRRKKRKGAKTSTSNYSMTSSSLARTDPLTTLDERFDKMQAKYSLPEFPEEDEDEYLAENASMASGMTGLSKASKMSRYSNVSGLSGVSGVSSYSRADDEEAPKLVRSDFDGIMDEFLGTHNKAGKYGKRVRRGAPQSGMEMLDEVRSGLGPARVGGVPRVKQSSTPVRIG